MLNAGFQYLEQRDANDGITKNGVVGKNSPFATSDNSGIYDIIAEDLRWLKENIDDVKDTSDLEAIKQSVTDMYNDMKNNSSFGATAAKAQAEEAKKQAQAALESATNAKTYRDDVVTKSTEANSTLAEIKNYIDKAEKLVASNKELEQSFSNYATVATNKANEASTSATKAATSETNAKASETKAKSSETNSKISETNSKTSETNAAESASNSAASATASANSAKAAETSASNAKTSEVNAKSSEVAAKTSETMASNSADLSKAWAESSDSPDSVNDTDSTTGKTQSSKSWAIYSKDRAISAFNSETNAKASEIAAKTSETNAKTSETNAATSASNAATSESHAKTSETNAKVSETNAKTSETNASTSKSNAATSASNAKSYMDTAKEYMQKAQEALAAAQAIQSIVDTAKANAEKCLADVEAVKESLAKMITYQGSVDNYSDLPTNPQVGYSYNVKNADKEHGVNAGDNVVWNGTDWDNFGSYVDMSLFAELGKDVRFNTVTATLNGNAATATKLQTPRTLSLTGKAAGSATFDGSSNAAINVTSVNADTATKLATARAISLTGNASGSANFDGSGNVSINATVNESKHAVNADNATNASHASNATKVDCGNQGSFITNKPGYNDYSPTVGGNYANVTIDSWFGVSFTSQCGGTVPRGKTAVGIDCREGIVRARYFEGTLNGNASSADSATNADTVDGYHENSFLRYRRTTSTNGENTLWNQIGIKEYNNVLPESLPDTYAYGAVISFPSENDRLDLWYDCYASNTGTGLYYRTGWQNEKRAWARLLDSNNYTNYAPTKTGGGASGTWGIDISGNAASASSVAWGSVTGKPSGIVKVASWDGSTLSLTTAT